MGSQKNRINLSSSIDSMETCQGVGWIAEFFTIFQPPNVSGQRGDIQAGVHGYEFLIMHLSDRV